MKAVAALSLFAPAALAAFYSKEEYDSGSVHEMVMEAKMASWDRHRAAGDYESSKYGPLGYVECIDGLATAVEGDANQTFKCWNADLYSFKSHFDLGSFEGHGSSSWGWVSDDGREFAIIGQKDGASFAEITSEGDLVYIGRLPQASELQRGGQWREIRTYKHYVVIGSEAYDHGIQVFDLTKLLDIDPANPVNFSLSDAAHLLDYNYLEFGRTHNIVVHEESGYAAAVGARPSFNSSCASGLIYIDLSDPTNPTHTGCAGQDGYVHDAQCVVYSGPDERYVGRDICYAYNEDTLTIYDSTERNGFNSSKVLSVTSYVGATYTHQGWLLDKEYQQYLILDDEYDEYDGNVPDGHPRTYIFDVSNLEDPKITGEYRAPYYGIDHNQYVYDGISYQSSYGNGFRVIDVSSIWDDPTGAGVGEIAYFDIYPEDDAEEKGGVMDFVGSWSSYANYPSGYILVNTIERGAFVIKLTQFEKRARGKRWNAPRRLK